jgi:phenylacetate-CoA ligase
MSMRKAAFTLKTSIAGRASLRTARDFLEAERLGPAELERLQATRAAAHAKFAMEHTAFYRDFYTAAGIRPSDLNDPDAFSSLPLIDKQLVRDNFDTIRSDEATPRTSAVSKTGGSTGTPLHILRDERFPARALEWRLFRWWGVTPWGDRGIVTRNMLQGRAAVIHSLQWWPSKRVELDAFSITDEAVERFAREWNSVNPPFLLGYAGGVLEVVRRATRLGLKMSAPKAVAVTAAPLTAGTRDEIERYFDAPCYDHYRSAEVPWIGGECSHQHGLHVFADVRRLEILDDELAPVPAGVEGEVVVSDLTNRVFPLIRYRLGDISSIQAGENDCGISLPRLGPISGRRSDAIRLPDGAMIAGALGHIFDHAPLSVRQFEIVQTADYAVTLRYIRGRGDDVDAAVARARATLEGALRGLVPLTLEQVETLPQVGGKMRFIRSDVVA